VGALSGDALVSFARDKARHPRSEQTFVIEGTRLGRYEICSKIGEGGMGEVYLAQDTKLDRKVAIKFLNEEFSRDSDKLNRFIQEAKAASALNHPNILTVYEVGEVDGKNYISTELIDGQTLRQKLSQKEAKSAWLGTLLVSTTARSRKIRRPWRWTRTTRSRELD
jgi:serine/threonine protein kinase